MNILLSLLGWLAWNFGLFTMEKDKADDEGKDFDIRHYVYCYWDNWVFSAIFIPILIIFGIKGLGLNAVPIGDFEDLQWSDAYYLAAGCLAEIAKYYITLIRKKWNSKA